MPDSRRPGRPPLVEGDTTTPVTIRVPSKEYDRVCERASRERVNVPDLIRRGLSRVLHEDEDD
jgi:hypothetical protein